MLHLNYKSMNIKIKDKYEAKMKTLVRLLLNDYENDIPIIEKKNSRIIELKDFPANDFLRSIRHLKEENQRLNLFMLALYEENKTLKAQLATTSNSKQDLEKNDKISALIILFRDTQKMSFQSIADMLNDKGFTNSRGRVFNKMQVNRLYTKSK